MQGERFEWDVAKSEMNLRQHGIDFDEATALWADPRKVVKPAPCKVEKRCKLHAWYAGSVWIAIFTRRGGIIRIISVRRATREEVSDYDRANYQRS